MQQICTVDIKKVERHLALHLKKGWKWAQRLQFRAALRAELVGRERCCAAAAARKRLNRLLLGQLWQAKHLSIALAGSHHWIAVFVPTNADLHEHRPVVSQHFGNGR